MKLSLLSCQIFSLVLSLGFTSGNFIPAQASTKNTNLQEQSTNLTEKLLAQRQSRLRFKVDGIRPSRAREGGISRGNCNAQTISITPLLPQTNKNNLGKNRIEVESTIAAHPTFFIHINETAEDSSAKLAEFILLNENGDRILYEKIFHLEKKTGILAISLPEDSDSLEIGESYHWYFSIVCDPDDRSGDVTEEGWVKRMKSVVLNNRLEGTERRNHPSILAEQGIWTDTITTLAELRSENPLDRELNSDWVSLLESVGLERFSRVPIYFVE